MCPESLKKAVGFTLLEILIALAIVALAFTGLFSVFSTALGVSEDVKRAKDLDQVARMALMQINTDLRSIYIEESESKGRIEDKANREKEINSKEEQEKDSGSIFQAREFVQEKVEDQCLLEFFSASSLDFDQPYPRLRVNKISYVLRSLQGDGFSSLREKPCYLFLRKEVPFAGQGLKQKEKVFEMASNVVSCKFSYQDSQGEIHQAWTEDRESLPDLVKVKLTLCGEKDRERSYTLQVDLPRRMGEDEG